MYALMKNNGTGTVQIVKTCAATYQQLIQQGHSELFSGTWKDCKEEQDLYLDERNEQFTEDGIAD